MVFVACFTLRGLSCGQIRLLGSLIFSKGEKERDFLDLPSVADVEPLIEGDSTTGKLTWTDFDFLHAGLALSGVSRVSLPLLTSVLALDIIAALMNWYNWPKFQILQPHGLQTRSEYCMES